MSETIERPKANVWLNGQAFSVSKETFEAFKRIRKGFMCRLCGHELRVGDLARWIYCNGTPGQATGNFFVCGKCDGPNEQVMAKGKESLALTTKLAKQWGIYGPDWQRYAEGLLQ